MLFSPTRLNLNVCVSHLPSSIYCSVKSTQPFLVILSTILDRVPYRPYTFFTNVNSANLGVTSGVTSCLLCLWWQIWWSNMTYAEYRTDMHLSLTVIKDFISYVNSFGRKDGFTSGLSVSTKIGERACSHLGGTPVDGSKSSCTSQVSRKTSLIITSGGGASCAYWPRSEESLSLARSTYNTCKPLHTLMSNTPLLYENSLEMCDRVYFTCVLRIWAIAQGYSLFHST